MIEKGALVIGHDPKGMDNFKELIDIEMAETAIDAIKETDCIILMTEWKEYTELNYETIKGEMNGNVVIDGRRGFNQKRLGKCSYCGNQKNGLLQTPVKQSLSIIPQL